jgi:hypothetical protein
MSLKCPKCGSKNWSREKGPNGNTSCRDCGFEANSKKWDEMSEKVASAKSSFIGGFNKIAKSKWEMMLKKFQGEGKHDLVRKMVGGISKTPPRGPFFATDFPHTSNVRDMVASNTLHQLTPTQVAAAARRSSSETSKALPLTFEERGSIPMNRNLNYYKKNNDLQWSTNELKNPDELVNISHGGERSFIDRFLNRNEVGYRLEGSTHKGIQVSPQLTNEPNTRDAFYARRAQSSMGGVPAVMTGQIPAKYLQKANKGSEAALLPKNVKYLQNIKVNNVSSSEESGLSHLPLNKTTEPFTNKGTRETASSFSNGFKKQAEAGNGFILYNYKKAEANSIIGVSKNLVSGLRKYDKGGSIKAPKTIKPGEAIAPRSDMPALPTMAVTPKEHNLSPSLPKSVAPSVRIPKP